MPLCLMPPVVGAEQAQHVRCDGPVVALLDLGLPDAAGYALARHWERRPGLQLVLILPSADCRSEAETLRAVDSLLPPIRLERLEQTLSRALQAIGPLHAENALPAWNGSGTTALAVEEVVYVRAEGKYAFLRTRHGEFLTDRSLAELLRTFPDRFLQVHRSAIVARAAIAGASLVTPELSGGDADPYWELVLDGVPERIPVARRRWPQVRDCVPRSGVGSSLTEAF